MRQDELVLLRLAYLTGIFSDEIADDVDLLPRIEPPRASALRSVCV